MRVRLKISGAGTGIADCPDGQIFEIKGTYPGEIEIIKPFRYRLYSLSWDWIEDPKEDLFDKLYLTLKDESKG